MLCDSTFWLGTRIENKSSLVKVRVVLVWCAVPLLVKQNFLVSLLLQNCEVNFIHVQEWWTLQGFNSGGLIQNQSLMHVQCKRLGRLVRFSYSPPFQAYVWIWKNHGLMLALQCTFSLGWIGANDVIDQALEDPQQDIFSESPFPDSYVSF